MLRGGIPPGRPAEEWVTVPELLQMKRVYEQVPTPPPRPCSSVQDKAQRSTQSQTQAQLNSQFVVVLPVRSSQP